MSAPGAPVPPRRITPLATPTYAPVGSGFPLAEPALVALVRAALEEDRAFDDVTTISTVVSTRHARAALVARTPGTLAGIPLALAAFRLLDTHVEIRVDAEDGTRVARGDTVLHLSGPARGLLSAERVALNFVQRLSGVATLTARYVAAVQGARTVIVDTRKTTPGWRDLEKYAVRCGGGRNHRRDLSDAVLIKDNHIAACDGDVAVAVARARSHVPAGLLIQVECDTVAQVRAAVAAGADALLLDNMGPALLRECVQVAKGHCWTEASGGVTLETVRAIAEAGVDRISIGALTHSAPALDLALDFE
ncbi:MAG: carboxylating nicotinate-nucleotide diphosphorylase [Gemmatimonadaceae bacterium]|nr:carboxylating nicotinate-nucleotide diphosphorylase [Gemmatimonadaceae bacterium]